METKPTYETKALVPYQPLTPATWQMILGVAETVHKSRIFGTGSEAEAAAIMLKGYEMGLSLTSSFEFIDSFLGQTGLKPRGALALIQQSPLCASLEIDDQVDDQGNPWACRVTMERTNGYKYTITVTMADAQRAGLVKPKSGWVHWPANMLRWRAVGFCADVVFSDVIGGMKRTDELTTVDEEGKPIDNMIDADPWSVVVKDPEPKKPEPVQPRIDMGFITDNWGYDLILEVNGGNIPNGQAEVERVCALLREQYPREEVF